MGQGLHFVCSVLLAKFLRFRASIFVRIICRLPDAISCLIFTSKHVKKNCFRYCTFIFKFLVVTTLAKLINYNQAIIEKPGKDLAAALQCRSHFNLMPSLKSSRDLGETYFQGINGRPKRCFSDKFFPKNLCGKLGIVGVPFGKGQKKKGTDEMGLKIAPDMLRKTGFIQDLTCIGADVLDYGNICYNEETDLSFENMHNLDHFAPCAAEVSSAVEKCLKEFRRCIVLGGDHSIAAPSIHAHMQLAGPKNVAVIYVDAHPDLNSNTMSPSGNIHGMTVALLAREMRDSFSEYTIPGLEWIEPSLSLNSIAYIGIRSVDPGEAKVLCDLGVAVFGMDDVEKLGINRTLSRALQRVDPGGNKSIHLSFDIDALDPNEAPSTTVPVRGGLTLREGIEIAEYLHKTQRLSVVDLVEVNAAIGTEIQRKLTLEAAKNILLAVGGHNRKGNVKPTTEEEKEEDGDDERYET